MKRRAGRARCGVPNANPAAGAARLKDLLGRLEVEVITIERDDRDPSVDFSLITQDCSKFYCIDAGRGMHQVGDTSWPVERGDLVFIPRGTTHVDNPVGRRVYGKFFCHFQARSAGLDLSDFLDLPAMVRSGTHAAGARRLFGELFALHHSPGGTDALRASARLRDIIALFIEVAPPKQVAFRWSPALTKLDQVIAALNADLCQEHRLDELALLVDVHPNHLCRLFTRNVGVPPHQYLKRLRLARAQELLRTTTLGIDEIAEAIGFANAQHFTKAFSAAFSMPPAHYRAVGQS